MKDSPNKICVSIFHLWLAFLLGMGICSRHAWAEIIPAVHDGFREVRVEEYFTCAVPRDWEECFDTSPPPQDEKKVYGFSVQGPWRGEIPVRISMHYYAEENLLYKSIDDYLRVFSKPALGTALGGDGCFPVISTKVSGRNAKVFERIKNDYVPLGNNLLSSDGPSGKDTKVYERREMMARPVPVRERFILFPAKSGFYALRYSAPAEYFEEFLSIFEKVAASFVTGN